tara:strand:+ start:429 stop:1220 length:792 start_codon:yes stop_codon:yes gene_type:complete
MDVPDLEVRKQLFVGDGETKALGEAEKAIRGSAYVEGPLQIGKDSDYSGVEATLMVGAQVNTDSDARPENAIKAKGDFELEGDINQTGDDDLTGTLVAGGEVKSNGGSHILSNKKDLPFDMPHPNKEGWRLRHVCIEGPEIAVYCRGRIKNSKEIVFPSYWDGLVDIDSITVQLTPIGAHQDVIVKRWDDKKVYLQPQGGMPIDCFYHIIAKRLDDDLIVEYEGNSHEDYPNGNEGYSFNWESSNMERIVREVAEKRLKELDT